MKTINEYVSYFNASDDGKFGKALEVAIKDYLGLNPVVSQTHQIDIKFKFDSSVKTFNRIEVKSGAGEIFRDVKGNSIILYVPVIDENVTVLEQEGFVFKRAEFIQALKKVGLYRATKITTHSTETTAIQTFWNRKLNKPHSIKKYNAFLDELYENNVMMLDEWLLSIK